MSERNDLNSTFSDRNSPAFFQFLDLWLSKLFLFYLTVLYDKHNVIHLLYRINVQLLFYA
jgi:hypothetical protein